MKYIKVRKANCKNCYKCLKNCEIKSIKYENEQVDVLEDQCVLCGNCIVTCPQQAKLVINDLVKVRGFIDDKNIKTFVSLAPSYVAAFGDNKNKVVSALKKIGFDVIEETSIGAAYVTREYKKLIEAGKMDNIITTCCHTVNMLVTKYYEELIPNMAPVLSPLMVHGKLIKEEYGKDAKVIFVGPCLSKINEIDENPQYIDGALTFQELITWLDSEGVNIDELEDEEFNTESSYSRIYPIADGILFDLKKQIAVSGTEKSGGYDLVSVSGLHNVIELLEEMKLGNVHGVFAEVNSCVGGCVNGPLMPEKSKSGCKNRLEVKAYADSALTEGEKNELEILRDFEADTVGVDMPTEQQIREILSQIGKYSKEQELNCGSCGYSTCREKAIAVYQKKAELYMCLPYMTDINQTMANVTLTLTPNYVIAVDENMAIKEFNVAAQKLFKVSRNSVLNRNLAEFIDTSDFEEVIKKQQTLNDKKVRYDELGIVTEQTIVYSEERNLAIGFIKDVTDEEKSKEQYYNMKLETVDMAQKVIDKQMTVAQQIASLLGETTAETKVTLSKLKNMIVNEGPEKHE